LVGFKGATQLAGQASSQFTKWAIGTGVEGGADFTTDIGTRFATGEDINTSILAISLSRSIFSAGVGEGVGEGIGKALSKTKLSKSTSINLANSGNFAFQTTADVSFDLTTAAVEGREFTKVDLLGSFVGSALGTGLSGLGRDSEFRKENLRSTSERSNVTDNLTGDRTSLNTNKTSEVDNLNPTKDRENNNLFAEHSQRDKSLETVLRGNEQVPVIRNNSLTGNTVKVHYDTDKNGLVNLNSIRIEAGPDANHIDVMLHARTVSKIKRYSGLLGRVIQLKNQIKQMLGMQTPEIGSLAWEAMLEIDKLERVIKFHMEQKNKGVDIQCKEEFEEQIANLEAQLARHQKTFEEMDTSAGVGYIAADGLSDLNKRLDYVGTFKDRFEKFSDNSATPELAIWKEKQKQQIEGLLELATTVKIQRDKLSRTTGNSQKKVKQELDRLVKEFSSEADAVEIQLYELEKLSQMYSEPNNRLAENELESLEDIHNVRNRLREAELKSKEPNRLSQEWQKISTQLDVEALRDYTPDANEIDEYEQMIAEPIEKASAEFSQIQGNVEKIYKSLGKEILEGKTKEYNLLNARAGKIGGMRSKLEQQKIIDLKNISYSYSNISLRNQILSRYQIELKNNYSIKELQNKISENWVKKDRELLNKIEAIDRKRQLIKEDIKDTIELGELSSWKSHNYGDPTIEPCFAPGTLVKTPKGYKQIEDFVIGDLVLAYDFNINEVVAQPILELYKSQTEYLVDIGIDGEIITATRQHRFWIESSREWLPASELQSGMKVRLANDNLTTVDFVKTYTCRSETYNLEVAEVHNYFVGNLGTLVHNGKGATDRESNFADTTKKDAKIYHIIDKSSGNDTVIYVGKTTQETVQKRFQGHLNKKPAWKKKRQLNLLEVEPIDKGKWTDYETAVWEQHYIDDALAKGYPIENDLTTPPISRESYDLYKKLHEP
ncbi:MAG: polymorphic toxin-type HINT domain-containing protein, partial [Prochloraceae cyanobacterium]